MINCSECGKFISPDWGNLAYMCYMCSECGYDWKATAEVESDPELSAILLAEGDPSEYVELGATIKPIIWYIKRETRKGRRYKCHMRGEQVVLPAY